MFTPWFTPRPVSAYDPKRTLLRAALALGPMLSLNRRVRVSECNEGTPSCRSKHLNEIDGRFCAAF